MDPSGRIARLREAIARETGLPYRSTGSSGNNFAEGHVTAGLRRATPRLATIGHFAGSHVYDLPLRLNVVSCPAVRRSENEELFRWCWLGLGSVTGLAKVIADADRPIALANLDTIRGIGPQRAKLVGSFFRRRGGAAAASAPAASAPAASAPAPEAAPQDVARAARLRRFEGGGDAVLVPVPAAPLSAEEMRARRLARFGGGGS